MTIKKMLLWLLSAIISVLFIFLSFGWIITQQKIGYDFVTVVKLIIFDTVKIPWYQFDLKGIWALMMNFQEFGSLFLKLNLLPAIPFALGAMLWLFLNSLSGWIIRATANRKTTLYGSSRWATEKELRKAGLLKKTGLVLGQTNDAEYKDYKASKMKRKAGENKDDFAMRKMKAAEVETRLVKKGDIIMQNGNAHTLIVGSTRSGKGVSVLIPTMFKWPESLIIFDPKAESWDISAHYRSNFSYTFKFQPERPNESIHYNPLLSIRRGIYAIPDIQNMAHILIPDNPASKEPFWDNEARKLLSATIGYVIYCEPPENKTFKFVYSIFSKIDELKAAMDAEKEASKSAEDEIDDEENDEDLSQIKQFLSYYAKNSKAYKDKAPTMPDELYVKFENRYNLKKQEREAVEAEAMQYLTKADKEALDTIYHHLLEFVNSPDQQLGSVVSSMTTNLQVIADPNVQAITDRSDFTMEDFTHGVLDDKGQRHPLSLYLCVSLSSMGRLIPLMRIFYEQAISLLTRSLEKHPYRLLLIFDEFYQMGKMEIVNKALALSAGYGILCCVAIQSYEQLKKVYESDAMFVDNFMYQVILRVNDPSTCDKIEKMLGQMTKQRTRVNTSGNVSQLTAKSESYDFQEQSRALMTSEEIRTMEDNTCVIISSGMKAYKGKKIRYYLDNRFTKFYKDKKGRILPPPDIIDNYPYVDNVDKNGKRLGLDSSGWHLLLGFKAAMQGKLETASKETLAQMEPIKVETEKIEDSDFIKEKDKEENPIKNTNNFFKKQKKVEKYFNNTNAENEIDVPIDNLIQRKIEDNIKYYMQEDTPIKNDDFSPKVENEVDREDSDNDDGDNGGSVYERMGVVKAENDEDYDFLTSEDFSDMEEYDETKEY